MTLCFRLDAGSHETLSCGLPNQATCWYVGANLRQHYMIIGAAVNIVMLYKVHTSVQGALWLFQDIRDLPQLYILSCPCIQYATNCLIPYSRYHHVFPFSLVSSLLWIPQFQKVICQMIQQKQLDYVDHSQIILLVWKHMIWGSVAYKIVT